MGIITDRHPAAAADARHAPSLAPSPIRPPARTAAPGATAAPAPATPSPLALSTAVSRLAAYGPTSALAFEQTLADLVRSAHRDRSALRAALVPLGNEGMTSGLRHDLPRATPLRQLLAVTAAIAFRPPPEPARTRVPHARGHVPYSSALPHLFQRLALRLDRPPGMDPYALRSPADLITLRLAELAARIGDPNPVDLVSTPTAAEGWIDPQVLFERIARLEDDGRQPLPLDFDQALLRLPEDAPAATVRAAHTLKSPAGHRLAGWLRGGRPTLPTVKAARADTFGPTPAPSDAALDTALSDAAPSDTSPLPSPLPATPTTLIHLLRRGVRPPLPTPDGSAWAVCWPALLPGHPDLVEPVPDGSVRTLAPVPLEAVARALTARSTAVRTDASQVLTLLAVSGSLRGDDLARALTAYATRADRQILRSAVPALQRALNAPVAPMATGAPQTTASKTALTRAKARALATAVLHWLPAVLPPAVPQPLPYTSHLLTVAADALALAHSPATPVTAPPAAVAALTALADRPSRSPVSDAAQRVLALLGE
jgi:hypothetical protein